MSDVGPQSANENAGVMNLTADVLLSIFRSKRGSRNYKHVANKTSVRSKLSIEYFGRSDMNCGDEILSINILILSITNGTFLK